MVEFPLDLYDEEVPDDLVYAPSIGARSAPDPAAVRDAAKLLVKAELPLLYAGQGVHYAMAWEELRELAELLEAPVTTSIEGKSAFPETHPLSLQSGGPIRASSIISCAGPMSSSASARASRALPTAFRGSGISRDRPSSTGLWTRRTCTRTSVPIWRSLAMPA